MMKKIIVILLIFFSVQLSYAQYESSYDNWKILLDDVKIRYVYAEEFDGFVSKPIFGKKIQALEGKTITIQGFNLPVNPESTSFVISHSPSSQCFFCSGAGVETLAEVTPRASYLQKFRNLKVDNYYEIKGRLRLNPDNYGHLIYILDDAVFIRLIRE